MNHPEFYVVQDSTPATPDNHLSTDLIVPCEEPASSQSVSSSETSPKDAVTVDKSVSVVPVGAGPSTSPLSDLLVCFAMNTPSVPKRTTTRARLLTSDESLQLLEEKERKKEMEHLEKENRKKERAAKKKEREELLKKKKEEQAKKAEEKAKRADENAKKENIKRKSPTTPPATEPGSSETTAELSTEIAGPSTSSFLDRINDESINANVCCMCFVNYEDDVLEGSGADWIYCRCGRWLHEDCVEDVVKDNDGEERYCSFCVDKFTI